MLPVINIDNTPDFCTFHIDTPTQEHHILAPQPHVPQIPSVYNQLACIVALPAQEPWAIEKNGTRWHEHQQGRDHAGPKRWVAAPHGTTDMADRIVPLKDTAQKTRHEHVR